MSINASKPVTSADIPASPIPTTNVPTRVSESSDSKFWLSSVHAAPLSLREITPLLPNLFPNPDEPFEGLPKLDPRLTFEECVEITSARDEASGNISKSQAMNFALAKIALLRLKPRLFEQAVQHIHPAHLLSLSESLDVFHMYLELNRPSAPSEAVEESEEEPIRPSSRGAEPEIPENLFTDPQKKPFKGLEKLNVRLTVEERDEIIGMRDSSPADFTTQFMNAALARIALHRLDPQLFRHAIYHVSPADFDVLEAWFGAFHGCVTTLAKRFERD